MIAYIGAWPMNPEARNALRTIQRCISAGRYELATHFRQRMAQRGMLWPDVLATVDDPASVQADGADDWGRARWIMAGTAADGLPLELVCVLDRTDTGELVVFITIYWKD
jgi:hypothetical protein